MRSEVPLRTVHRLWDRCIRRIALEGSSRIIGGSEGADGKTAYEIALEAARPADEDNVALPPKARAMAPEER